MIDISIHPELKGTIKIAVLLFTGLNCCQKNEHLWAEIESLAENYCRAYPEPSAATEELKPARDLYRRIGIEPTRTRPSSEALLRRAIKGRPLYQINSIVDVSNLCSLNFLLPIGLYDLDKIAGNVVLRSGLPGEEYPGIRKEMIHVEGRYTLADDLGAFGNPSADSLRTSVDLDTKEVLFVIFCPNDYPDANLEDHIKYTNLKMLEYHSGKLTNRSVIN
jgi:DNA/RNA-binding domain of Phe-tRNA-synthetase-like protein